MTDSKITIFNGGVIAEGPDGVKLYNSLALKHALKLFINTGIIPTRGWTITKALATVSHYTGKPYKRGQAKLALADLDSWCEAMKAAIPMEDKTPPVKP